MTGHVIALKQHPLNRKRGWTTTFLTPERAWSQRDNYQAHLYSKEDCGRDDPSMSPGSRSGRGAMTLTPAPNGAKEFNVAFLNIAAGIEHGALDVCPLRSSSRSTRRPPGSVVPTLH